MKRFSWEIILLMIFLSSCVPNSKPTAGWNQVEGPHTIVSDSHLKVIWEKPIYTEDDSFGCPCVAMDGTFIVIGSEESEGKDQMISLDSKDGKTKWSKEVGLRFSNSRTQLFIGNGQTVISLSPVDGSENWKTFLPEARHIGKQFYFDDKLYINASGSPFFVLSPEDGRVIEKYSSVDGFRRDYPTVPFYQNLNFQPIIIGDDSILSLGDSLYTIRRENLTSNNLVWEIVNDAISNSTIINNTLFYISKDDKLKAIDVNTGELLYDASIQPSIEFFNLEKMTQHDGYFVCSDQANKFLYVILGDSRQLFAFSVSENN
jgi:outer membrane protein assembly factor BamB